MKKVVKLVTFFVFVFPAIPSTILSMKNTAEMALFFRAWLLHSPFPPSSSPHSSTRTGAKLAAFLVFAFLFSPLPILNTNYTAKMAPLSSLILIPLSIPSMNNMAEIASLLMLDPSASPLFNHKNVAEMASFFVLDLYFPPSASLSSNVAILTTFFVFVFLSCSPTLVPISRILFLYIIVSSSNEIYLLLPKIVQLSVEMIIYFLVRVGHGWSFSFVPITLDNADYSDQC